MTMTKPRMMGKHLANFMVCKFRPLIITSGWIIAILVMTNSSYALEVQKFRDMYGAEDYEELVILCTDMRTEIEADEYVDRLLYYCGQAKFMIFQKGGPETFVGEGGPEKFLEDAIDDLERSTYSYYLPSTVFALGKARMLSISKEMEPRESLSIQRRALGEMWDAIQKKHAQEDFNAELLSDQILGWTIEYYKALIDGLIKDDNLTSGWLTARIRMICDRYTDIKPKKAKDQTRKGNLETVTGWMHDLYESTYFDGNSVIGIYKFMGDRSKEEYDQTETTEPKFIEALEHYKKGLSMAGSLKAKAVLMEKISDLTQWIITEEKEKKINYYMLGFQHARDAYKLLASEQNESKMAYHFEPDTKSLIGLVEKDYGQNLSGLLYFLWEKENYKGVVALRNAFQIDFDWKTKLHDMLRVSDAAAKLARAVYELPKNQRNLFVFQNYQGICLTYASHAFNYVLKKYEQDSKTHQEDFCTTLDAYTAFLVGFGEIAENRQMTNLYEPRCKDKSTAKKKKKAVKKGTKLAKGGEK